MNEAKPLALYKMGCRDAEAGAKLIQKRWPETELVETARLSVIRANQARENGRHAWCLGFGEDAETPRPEVTSISAAPDASIAMQVWRLLHPYRCPTCLDGDSVAHVPPEPPWWLQVFDSEVCGRPKDEESEIAWAWMRVSSVAWWLCIRDEGGGVPATVLMAGRAVLEAEKPLKAELERLRTEMKDMEKVHKSYLWALGKIAEEKGV